MEAIKIEILNPKALKLIKGMQDLELIRISDEPGTKIKKLSQRSRRELFQGNIAKKKDTKRLGTTD
jgi:hypothetical protein